MHDVAIRGDAAARDYDPDDLTPVVKVLTPGQATRLGWSFLAGGVLLLAGQFWWCFGFLPSGTLVGP